MVAKMLTSRMRGEISKIFNQEISCIHEKHTPSVDPHHVIRNYVPWLVGDDEVSKLCIWNKHIISNATTPVDRHAALKAGFAVGFNFQLGHMKLKKRLLDCAAFV